MFSNVNVLGIHYVLLIGWYTLPLNWLIMKSLQARSDGLSVFWCLVSNLTSLSILGIRILIIKTYWLSALMFRCTSPLSHGSQPFLIRYKNVWNLVAIMTARIINLAWWLIVTNHFWIYRSLVFYLKRCCMCVFILL